MSECTHQISLNISHLANATACLVKQINDIINDMIAFPDNKELNISITIPKKYTTKKALGGPTAIEKLQELLPQIYEDYIVSIVSEDRLDNNPWYRHTLRRMWYVDFYITIQPKPQGEIK
jgi:hypothetical protein